MRKISLVLGITALLAVGGYVIYRVYLPNLVAQSITSEVTPSFVPQRIKTKIEKIRKPINESAAVVIGTMHKSGITLDQIIAAIDNAQEEQAYAMLDELNQVEIKNPDQVFDLAKKHFPVDFDVEVFRKPFKEKVNVRLIKKGLRYANAYRNQEEFDVTTAKSILKKILLQKEDEFNRLVAD